MSDVTRILSQIEEGHGEAAEQLLPLVYDELRKLAARKMAREAPGQTLQATALVHEAYIRLVDVEKAQHWNSRGHFFAAAAEAMRRILVERARQKQRHKRGGGQRQQGLPEADLLSDGRVKEILDVDRMENEISILRRPWARSHIGIGGEPNTLVWMNVRGQGLHISTLQSHNNVYSPASNSLIRRADLASQVIAVGPACDLPIFDRHP